MLKNTVSVRWRVTIVAPFVRLTGRSMLGSVISRSSASRTASSLGTVLLCACRTNSNGTWHMFRL